MKQPDKRTPFLFITLGIVAILLLLIDMATGDTYIPITKVWAVLTGGECDEMTRNILLSIRFIRVVVAALIGIALSVSGLQMQTVFQNPLADPYLLGVSSGAGLGVALFILGAPLLGWAEFPILQSLGIVGSGWIGTAISFFSTQGGSSCKKAEVPHTFCNFYQKYSNSRPVTLTV